MPPKYFLPDGSSPEWEQIQTRTMVETVKPLTPDDYRGLLISELVWEVRGKTKTKAGQRRLLDLALEEPTMDRAISFVRDHCRTAPPPLKAEKEH